LITAVTLHAPQYRLIPIAISKVSYDPFTFAFHSRFYTRRPPATQRSTAAAATVNSRPQLQLLSVKHDDVWRWSCTRPPKLVPLAKGKFVFFPIVILPFGIPLTPSVLACDHWAEFTTQWRKFLHSGNFYSVPEI
jgi:hypothetical protein